MDLDPLWHVMIHGDWFTAEQLAARVRATPAEIAPRLARLAAKPGARIETQDSDYGPRRIRLKVDLPAKPKKARSSEPVEQIELTDQITRCTHCHTPTCVDAMANALERFFGDEEPGWWREVCNGCGQRYDVHDDGDDE